MCLKAISPEEPKSYKALPAPVPGLARHPNYSQRKWSKESPIPQLTTIAGSKAAFLFPSAAHSV